MQPAFGEEPVGGTTGYAVQVMREAAQILRQSA